MAKLNSTIFLIISSILIATTIGNHATTQNPPHEANNSWFQSICHGKLENKAKLHFYLHDQFTGENQTAFEVARASITSTSPTLFGKVLVVDDPLTVEPDINSKEVGRAQGLVTGADLTTIALAMNLNFVFTSGKYNGSTISILGRDPIAEDERELPIVGGTGIFRFVRGYAITRTIVLDLTDRAIFEYTLYVTYGRDSNLSLRQNMQLS